MRVLEGKGIGCGIHYPVPIHLQQAYQNLGYGEGAFPVSERICSALLSLPMFPELTLAQVELVADSVKASISLDAAV
jgi:dTDP-4-amino-4,6-dideoxygalactose transaminase